MYVDANGLHELNNTQGHETGDLLLQAVGYEMQRVFGNERCYRIGGDEFVALLPEMPEDEVFRAVDQMEQALKAKGYSVAFGIADTAADAVDAEALLRLAEQRMYAAKETHYQELEHDQK